MNAAPRLALLFFAALLSFAGGRALAAAHLTLKEVVQTVVLTNPEVLVKWHAFKSASAEVDVARAGFLPKLDLTASVGRERLRQPGVADRDFSSSGSTLTLTQMLYDGFTTSNDVKRMGKAQLTRYFELLDAAEAAALEGARAYFDVIRYRQLMLLAENNYVEHRSSYELLLRRAQSGAGRRVDVEHASSRLALAELNLNTEAANLHDVTARFLRLVGHPPPPVMFAPPRIARDYPGSEPDALKMAFRRNPTLRAAVENVESTLHDLEMRRGAFHPKLDLRLRNESNGNYQGTIGTRQNNVAEVLLSYNLFNGGADVARQRVFSERRNMALDQRDKACVDVRQTLSIAYNEVLRLRAQQANLDQQVGAIERTRDAYKAQFNIGQRSLLDLLDTENELLNARRTAVNADVDVAFAYLRTQAGIGRLLEHLELKRIDDADQPDPSGFAVIVEADICPPEAPGSYLVNLDALTARALAQLDATKPPAPPLPLPTPAVPGPNAMLPSADAPPLQQARVPASTSASVAAPVRQDVSPSSASGAEAQELTTRVKAWAAAWAGRDIAGYAAFYAPTFVPADGSSRDAWAKQRAQRIAAADQVRVDVSNFIVRHEASEAVLVEFQQQYRSTTYRDVTLKALRWIKVDGQWLIEREAARPVPSIASIREGSGT
ncbi:MAG: TolC family outer membrane protein [Sulfuritalea sp.]|nr:TolC family outer membrane protein [Sulfuritalea sp.]